jgi:hypothetical protein
MLFRSLLHPNSSRLLTEQLTEPIKKPFVRVQKNVIILYKRENPMDEFPKFLVSGIVRKVSGKKCPNVSHASGIGKDRVKEEGCAIEPQSKSSFLFRTSCSLTK